jgi:hypothetical protein
MMTARKSTTCKHRNKWKQLKWFPMSETHLLTNIRAESEEWNILEHYFMACSRTFRARMRQAFSLTSPKIQRTFSYQSSPMPTPSIYVWVNTEELNDENQLEKVLKRGETLFSLKYTRIILRIL